MTPLLGSSHDLIFRIYRGFDTKLAHFLEPQQGSDETQASSSRGSAVCMYLREGGNRFREYPFGPQRKGTIWYLGNDP